MLKHAARRLSGCNVHVQLQAAASGSAIPNVERCFDRRGAHQQSGSNVTEAAGPGPGSDSEEMFLQLYRRHNSSLKHLKGQVIGARVFKTDRRFVFLDTGIFVLAPQIRRLQKIMVLHCRI